MPEGREGGEKAVVVLLVLVLVLGLVPVLFLVTVLVLASRAELLLPWRILLALVWGAGNRGTTIRPAC